MHVLAHHGAGGVGLAAPQHVEPRQGQATRSLRARSPRVLVARRDVQGAGFEIGHDAGERGRVENQTNPRERARSHLQGTCGGGRKTHNACPAARRRAGRSQDAPQTHRPFARQGIPTNNEAAKSRKLSLKPKSYLACTFALVADMLHTSWTSVGVCVACLEFWISHEGWFDLTRAESGADELSSPNQRNRQPM